MAIPKEFNSGMLLLPMRLIQDLHIIMPCTLYYTVFHTLMVLTVIRRSASFSTKGSRPMLRRPSHIC